MQYFMKLFNHPFVKFLLPINIKEPSKILGKILYCWYIYSLIATAFDIYYYDYLIYYKGEVINVMCLAFIWNTLQVKPKVNVFYTIIGGVLFLWYSYYTWQDAENTNIYLRIIYTAIDVLTWAYVTDFLATNPLSTFIIRYFERFLLNSLKYCASYCNYIKNVYC